MLKYSNAKDKVKPMNIKGMAALLRPGDEEESASPGRTSREAARAQVMIMLYHTYIIFKSCFSLTTRPKLLKSKR
jgi:hypothetical protein